MRTSGYNFGPNELWNPISDSYSIQLWTRNGGYPVILKSYNRFCVGMISTISELCARVIALCVRVRARNYWQKSCAMTWSFMSWNMKLSWLLFREIGQICDIHKMASRSRDIMLMRWKMSWCSDFIRVYHCWKFEMNWLMTFWDSMGTRKLKEGILTNPIRY